MLEERESEEVKRRVSNMLTLQAARRSPRLLQSLSRLTRVLRLSLVWGCLVVAAIEHISS